MPKNLDSRSWWRIIPAFLLAFFSFSWIENAFLEFQYKIRGAQAVTEEIVVIRIGPETSPLNAFAMLQNYGFKHCVNLHPNKLGIPECLEVDLDQTYTLGELQKNIPLFLKYFHPEKALEAQTPQNIYFWGGLSEFKNLALEDFIAQSGFLTASQKTLVFIPDPMSVVPLATPAGTLSQTEAALNLIVSTRDQKFLVPLSLPLKLLFCFLLCLLGSIILYNYPPLLTAVLFLLLASSVGGSSFLLFRQFGIQMPLATSLLCLIALFMLGTSDLLDRHERNAWSLQIEEDNLRKLDEMRKNFVSLVSHDLKTPIARIQALVEGLLRGDSGGLNLQQKEQLEKVVSASGHLQRTFSSLLLLNRVESGQIDIKREPSDLPTVLQESIKAHENQAREKEVRLSLETEPMFLVELDQGLIQEVVHNLVDNALKFAPPHSEIILRSGEDDISSDLLPPQPAVWFEVQDFGPGIAPEYRSKIFKKFTRADKEILPLGDSSKGTGLGLFLSSYFVQQHGGKIHFFTRQNGENLAAENPSFAYFSSTPHGTVIRVTLPIENLH